MNHAPLLPTALLAALALPLLTPAAEPALTTTAPAGVRVEQAWIRWLPAKLPAGGFVTITNASDQPQSLVGAISPDYAQVQLHRTITQAGLSRMVPVARITIAPHSTLSFAAHGYHLMLMRPTLAISPGDHVPVTLQFANGGALRASFLVRSPSATVRGDMGNMPGMQH